MTRNEQTIAFINTVSSHIEEFLSRFNRFLILRVQVKNAHNAISEANLYIYTESLCDLINTLCIERDKNLYTIRNMIFLSGRTDLVYKLDSLFDVPLNQSCTAQKNVKEAIKLCANHYHGKSSAQQPISEVLQYLIDKEYSYNMDYIVANILNYTKQGLNSLYAEISTSQRIYNKL